MTAGASVLEELGVRPLTDQELESLMSPTPETAPEGAKPPPWKCPICGARTYTESGGVWNQMVGPGSRADGSHLECLGCTVHFTDPVKFNSILMQKSS